MGFLFPSTPALAPAGEERTSRTMAGCWRLARTFRGLGIAALIIGATTASAAAAPVVTAVQIDDALDTIQIIGQGFTAGPRAPSVALGVVGDISASCQTPPATDTLVTCTLTSGLPPAGDYLLTVSTGSGDSQTTTYALTIGAVGPQGPEGLKGATGPTGAVGPQGAKGDTGTTGAQGPTGGTGAVGPQGAQGDTGATGPTGPQGPQGLQGNTGPFGFAGPQGPPGPTGPTGPPGPSPANQTCSGSTAVVVGFDNVARIICVCPGAKFVVTATANVEGPLNTQSWPGGVATFGDGMCTGTVTRPSGRIDGLDSHEPWKNFAVTPMPAGWSRCTGEVQFPRCNAPAAIPGLEDNGFPRCSAGLGTTASEADYIVTCGQNGALVTPQ